MPLVRRNVAFGKVRTRQRRFGRCVAVCFRGRTDDEIGGRVSRAPVNSAVESVSAFFPCYNDEPTIGRMVETAVTSERVLKRLTETRARRASTTASATA